MKIVNLKSTRDRTLRYNELARYYDKAYLLESDDTPAFIGIVTQELHNEPYMDLDEDEVDLMHYQSPGSLEGVINFIGQHTTRPQIIRALEVNKGLFTSRGWKPIYNRDGSESILRKVRRYILPDELFEISPQIRLMEENDLPFIEELFRREYPLRYRMVQYLYDQDKEGNFVFEDKDGICGVTFTERRPEYLYCRQIFVKEAKRGQGIGTKLNQFRLAFARDNGLYVIFANIRGESEGFHLKQGVEISTEREFYLKRYPGEENI